MNNYSISEIGKIAIHNVGNKTNDEGIFHSKKTSSFDKDLNNILVTYFISPFKSKEYYSFHHDTDLHLNEVFVYVSAIFDHPNNLYKQSINLANHLYNCNTHPQIKGGEFYVVYFKDCILEGKEVDAVGLFKSEIKETFLRVFPQEEIYHLESDNGINISKLDKGCLIFNTESKSGFTVATVDNTNRSEDAKYWKEDFLSITPKSDDFHKTQDVLSLYKKFVMKELPQEFDISKTQQVDLLNKSIRFFKENDSFDMDDFTHDVIENPQIITKFNNYKTDYQFESKIQIPDSFTISEGVVKKYEKKFKSILKLDKNFQIHITGDASQMEGGYDKSRGKKYYKLYYDEES